MTDNYRPQVGDRIRHTEWHAGGWLDVRYVDDRTVAGYDEENDWFAVDPQQSDGPWVKVETPEPLPEAWHILWAKDGGFGRPYPSPEEAKMFAQRVSTSYPVAIVHVWSDADGEYAEIERL